MAIDWNKVGQTALPIAGGIVGGVATGGNPAGIALGMAAGGAGASIWSAATTPPPKMPTASGAERGLAELQSLMAEQSASMKGISSGEVALTEDVRFRQSLRNLNLMNQFNSIYNVDPAAQQMVANNVIQQLRDEGKDVRKEIQLMDIEAVRAGYERTSTLAARASAAQAEIRRQEQAAFMAEQEFYTAQANAISQNILGLAEAAAGYAEYMQEAGIMEQQAANEAALRKEVAADQARLKKSKEDVALLPEMAAAEKVPVSETIKKSDLNLQKRSLSGDAMGVAKELEARGLPLEHGGILTRDDIIKYNYEKRSIENQKYLDDLFKFYGFNVGD